ncbi:nuclear pore complex protein Nup214 [Onthophagus taurus]|uniref:nuclear pore complex protein Nup214 n=1 Tax=Onthophagus taurus TaxID=166361 RepID=UPI0039BDDF6A
MAKTAPSPIDVVDFQFKLQCKLKAFENDSHETFKLPCSLVCSASRYGLLFVGTSTPKFQVIQIQDIQNYAVKDGHVSNYKRRYINLPSNPRYLGVNCDSTKLCVIVEKDGCVKAVIYDVVSFLKQNVVILQEIRLSTTPGVNILDICWNPGVPSMLAVCKDDGSLGLYNVKENGIEIKELPKTTGCTCSCWSPKGKQLVVGTANGKLTQYKLDLQVAKSINPPPINGNPQPISLQWISNYQFIGVYKTVGEDVQMSLIVVDAPKAGETTYTNYDDVCYSYGNSRPHQFYMLQQPLWNILLVASSNSMEVGVMHLDKDSWTQWILTDSARAELPLNAIKQDTLPVGLGFDISSVKPLPWGEGELPPMPYLFLLSHQGVLCCFSIINLKEGVPKLCTPPEPLTDLSGLVHFTIGDNESVRIQTTSTNLVKPTPVAQIGLQQQAKIPAFGASTPPAWGNLTSPVSIATQKTAQTPTFFNKPATGVQNILGAQPQTIITPVIEIKKAENVQENIQKPIIPQTMPQTTPGLQQQNALFGMTTKAPSQPSWAFTPPQTTLVPQKPPQPPTTTFFNKPITQNIFGTQPQPVVESQKVDSTQENLQKAFGPKTVVSAVEPKETSGIKTPPAGIPAINEETEKLLAQMMKEECINLEMEIKVLMAGSNIKIDFGADSETVSFIEGATALQDFLKEMDETSSTQAAEIHALKQNMIQTWVWYEEARSRYATYKDPALKSLLALQPLDAASERKLDEIRRMIYYLESQLMQANSALDDQWDAFQSSCKRKINTKSLSIESIYQVMVKQNATLQKQIYILKDISMRIRAKLRSLNAPRLLVSLDNTEPLEEQLKSLHMEPKDLMELRYEKVFKKQRKLTKEREDKLKACFQNGNVSHVVVRKPQLNSFMQMSGLGVIPFSPIAPKKNQGEVKKHIDFVQSTPLVKVTQEKENVSSPAVVNLFNKQEQQNVGGDVKTSAFVPMVNTKNNLFGNLDQNISTKQQNWQKPVGETVSKPPTFNLVSQNTNFMIPKSSSGNVDANTNPISKSSTFPQFGASPQPFTLLTNKIPENKTPSTTIESKTPEATTWDNTKPFSFFGQGLKTTSESSPFSGNLSKSLFGDKSTPSSPDVNKPPNFGNTPQSGNDLKTTFTQNVAKTAPSLFNQGFTTTVSTTQSETKMFTSPSTWVVTSTNQEKASIVSTKPTSSNVTVQPSLFPTSKLEQTTPQTPPTPIINIPTFRQSTTTGLTFGSTTITSSVSVPVSTTKPPPIVQSIQSTFPTTSPVVPTDSATTTPSTTTSVMSATTTTSTATTVSTPMFGVTTTTSIFGQKPSIFSQPVAEGQSIFAKTASNFVQNTQATTANKTPSIFSNTAITSSFKFTNVAGETPFGQTTGTTPAVADQAPTICESATSPSFGQTPTTGSPAPSVSSTTSIFGQAISAPTSFEQITPPPSTTIPAFGQTTPSTSIGFGSTALTQTSTSSVFGQTQVSSTPSVFGQATTVPPSVFAQTITSTSPSSVFGQTVSTPSAFGQTTSVQSVFGQSNVFQQKTSPSSIFSSTPTSDFGKVANPAFGAASTTSTVFGQSQQQPTFGQPNTLFGGTTTASIFGQPTSSSSIFGQPTTSTTSIFEQPTTSTSSVFGQPTTSTSSVFGQPTTSTSSVFGQPTTSTSSVFGQPTTSTTSVFGQPITSTSSVFGQAVTSTPSVFGQAVTSTPSVFGQSSFGSNSIFKSSTNSVFGGSSPFGSTPTTSSAFGSSSPFGASNVFGRNTTNNVFGKSNFGTSDNLNFGNLSTGANPTPATSSSVFGGSSFNTFRTADKEQFGGTSTNVFEPPTTSTTPVFGGSLFNKSTPAFGAPATFGAAPTFSQPSAFGSSFSNTFGNANQSAGPFSGGASTQTVSQSGFGSPTTFQKPAFGSPSAFGAQPTGFGSPASFGGAAFGNAPAFGSPNRVFGSNEGFGAAPQQQSSTFANLANQQTIGFGSVAQQAAPVENMQQPSFTGGSSFTSWR